MPGAVDAAVGNDAIAKSAVKGLAAKVDAALASKNAAIQDDTGAQKIAADDAASVATATT